MINRQQTPSWCFSQPISLNSQSMPMAKTGRISIFLTLAVFLAIYFFYILFVTVDTTRELAFIIICAGMYIVYVTCFTKPETSIYFYLLIWILFPKSAFSIPGVLHLIRLPGSYTNSVYVFNFLEAIAAFTICLRLMQHQVSQREIKINNPLDKYMLLFIISGVMASIVAWVNQSSDAYRLFENYAGRFNYMLLIIYGVIIYFGCSTFITTTKKVEKIFKLFILSGTVMSLELFATYLNLVFPYSDGAFHISGRFNSFTQGDYYMVSLLSIMAILSLSYFIVTRKKYILAPLLGIFMINILASYERTCSFSIVIAVISFIYFSYRKYRHGLVFMLLLGLILVSFNLDAVLIANIDEVLRGDYRKAYFNIGSLWGRMATYFRAFDAIIYTFPFGTGLGAGGFYMNLVKVPNYFSQLLPDHESAERLYGLMITGQRQTDSHNFYIKLALEQGLFGATVLGLFIMKLVSMFRIWRKQVNNLDLTQNRVYAAEIACYSMLITLSIWYLVSHNPPQYFIPFLFIGLIQALSTIKSRLSHR